MIICLRCPVFVWINKKSPFGDFYVWFNSCSILFSLRPICVFHGLYLATPRPLCVFEVGLGIVRKIRILLIVFEF